MTTVQLELPGAGVRWEATLEGPNIEVVRELLDPPRAQVQQEAYETPLVAREALEEMVEELLEAGFVHLDVPRPQPTPGEASLEELAALTVAEHEHPAMLEAIVAEPRDPAAYLVYADWLQEHGDPLGHLIALSHAAEGVAVARAGVMLLHRRFGSHFAPALRPEDSASWRWGFIDMLVCGESLAALAAHRCTAVLRELRCQAEDFAALPATIRFPHVTTLVLEGLDEDCAPLDLTRVPSLECLVLDGAEGQDAVLAQIRELPPLRLLGIQLFDVWEDSVLPLADGLKAIDPRPALWLDMGDPYMTETVVEELGRDVEVVSELPSATVFYGTRRTEDEDEDEDDDEDDEWDEDEDWDAGSCGGCGYALAKGDDTCPSCGQAVAHEDPEDDGVDAVPEVCPHDAARDPNHDAGGVEGVDRRWDAPKDDVFDIDDT